MKILFYMNDEGIFMTEYIQNIIVHVRYNIICYECTIIYNKYNISYSINNLDVIGYSFDSSSTYKNNIRAPAFYALGRYLLDVVYYIYIHKYYSSDYIY